MSNSYKRAWGATRTSRAARIRGRPFKHVSPTCVRVPSQRKPKSCSYDVTIDARTGRATDCDGPDRLWRHAYCKHMRAVNMRL